ncbi:PEGA domain protein [Gemmatirosa kalamazoonensis]|uniref:PEGA domain protein n=1 Tax=Gemmatirosa kalamazoonensis TaxID=861299 RepID=W0RG37_9BACT|nr:PEGA domain-containing protein [Gemmatirosa kalamazoonensis]AHG88358.1 PEGA domain protein [Gemmatirosa kalamazoonensis]
MSTRPVLTIAALLLCATACGEDGAAAECIIPPCALRTAVQLTVTSARGPGPVAGVTLVVAGAVSGSGACSQGDVTTCLVPGTGGTYEIDVRAPGYQTAHRTVTVTATPRECSCPLVDTQRVDVVLTPAA